MLFVRLRRTFYQIRMDALRQRFTDFRVGGLREKQLQLAAQKRNDAFLKYSSCMQTARYFERECYIAEHYDSWNYKDIDSKKPTEKADKEGKLAARRTALMNLFKTEGDAYEKEMLAWAINKEEKRRTSFKLLQEKGVEEHLYFPSTYRKRQSSCSRLKSSISTLWADPGSMRQQLSPNIYGGLTNFDGKTQENLNEEHRAGERLRYARRSLENTNVRADAGACNDYISKQCGKKPVLTSNPLSSVENIVLDSKINSNEGLLKKDDVAGDKYENSLEARVLTNVNRNVVNRAHIKTKDLSIAQNDEVNGDVSSRAWQTGEMQQEQSGRYAHDKEGQTITQHQQFQTRNSIRSLKRQPNGENLPEQVILYPSHLKIRHKIEDLKRRESYACTKQSWNEALRLRHMRNRLELVREKRLFGMTSSKLDDEARSLRLASIDRRAEQIARREEECTNANMYSEEAKDLWKQWTREDESFLTKNAHLRGDNIINDDEKE